MKKEYHKTNFVNVNIKNDVEEHHEINFTSNNIEEKLINNEEFKY